MGQISMVTYGLIIVHLCIQPQSCYAHSPVIGNIISCYRSFKKCRLQTLGTSGTLLRNELAKLKKRKIGLQCFNKSGNNCDTNFQNYLELVQLSHIYFLQSGIRTKSLKWKYLMYFLLMAFDKRAIRRVVSLFTAALGCREVDRGKSWVRFRSWLNQNYTKENICTLLVGI